MAVTASSRLYAVPGPGLGTMVQTVPSQCMMSGGLGLERAPTTHTSVEETADTPTSCWFSPLISGVGTLLQTLPFQCMLSGWTRLLLSVYPLPTAQISFAETIARPERRALSTAGFGLGTTLH